MKKLSKTMWGALLLAGLLVGCGNEKQTVMETQVKLLKNQVTLMQMELEDMRSSQTNLAALASEFRAANHSLMNIVSNELSTMLRNFNDDVASQVQAEVALQLARTNAARAAQIAGVRGARPAAPAMKGGVPLEVYNQIEAEAQRRYPSNYEMQKFVIENQIEAYQKLRAAR